MPPSVPWMENLCLRIYLLDYSAWTWCLQINRNSLTKCGCLVAYNPRQPGVFKQVFSKANNDYHLCVAYTWHKWCVVKVLSQLVFTLYFSFYFPSTRMLIPLISLPEQDLQRLLHYKVCILKSRDRNFWFCVLSGFFLSLYIYSTNIYWAPNSQSNGQGRQLTWILDTFG